jgi:3-dehydroquinate synthase
VIDQSFRVGFHYPVHFTRDVFGRANALLKTVVATSSPRRPADLVVVVDDAVVRLHDGLVDRIEGYVAEYRDDLRLTARILAVQGGEEVKNDQRHLDAIHRTIHDGALCRHSYVIAVGGGAVLDAVGYAAATAHRGIRLVRVPTTVLAQDDSAMGVKNGINAFGKKNYLGTFAPPFAVINDLEFLSTLQDRDWLSGVSEAVKVALIKDAGFFAQIEREAPRLVQRDAPTMEEVIRRSAALHLAHISGSGDPFELTSSRPLDFGHWAAHKLEELTRHRLRHGEAVAIGMALDSTYSHLLGELPEPDWTRIVGVIQALRLSVFAPELAEHLDDRAHPRCVLQGLEAFREHLGGQLSVMLLRSIGRAFDVHEIDPGVMMRSIDVLERLEASGAARRPERAVAASAPRGLS